MTKDMFNDILTQALWDFTHDIKLNFQAGLPITTGIFGMLLNVDTILTASSIIVGLLVGVVSLISKVIDLYKQVLELRKAKKETDKEALDEVIENDDKEQESK
jgi:hypothetical protein